MTILSNVHVHSTWCDGANTPLEMAEAALKLGFTDLGFSSHSKTPFDPDCEGIQDEDAYIADINSLKKLYEGRLNILCGVEEDLYAPVEREKYDYVISSSHYLRFEDGRYRSVDSTTDNIRQIINVRYSGDALAMVKQYYAGVVQNAMLRKPFIIGHFDLVKKYNAIGCFFDEDSKAYKDIALYALDEVLDIVLPYGGIFEVNTGAMARGFRKDPYPSEYLLKHIAGRGGRVIITADSHSADTLNYAFNDALCFVKECGFKQIVMLSGGKFIDISVEA